MAMKGRGRRYKSKLSFGLKSIILLPLPLSMQSFSKTALSLHTFRKPTFLADTSSLPTIFNTLPSSTTLYKMSVYSKGGSMPKPSFLNQTHFTRSCTLFESLSSATFYHAYNVRLFESDSRNLVVR